MTEIWETYPHPQKPYSEIPTFVIDHGASAYEGDTMHKVGRLFRGDYCVELASELMAMHAEKFLRNLVRSGFTPPEAEAIYQQVAQSALSRFRWRVPA